MASCEELLTESLRLPQHVGNGMCAMGACRDVESSQEASCEAALDQLQRSKRKMLPIVNAAGELVSHPTTSEEM